MAARRLCGLRQNATFRGSFMARTLATKKQDDLDAFDGCTAASHVAYACSENAFIYPISPSSSMGELVDLWATQGRKNIFGQKLNVKVMQSEAGAAGALHGAMAAGSLGTTFTSSQGLLLMIPNMYLLSGELKPAVFHVAARAIARQALSIFGDHQDVMATRNTGFAQLSSYNVQEVMDLGLVAHLAAVKSRVPFMHFFDGYRTSHGIQKIQKLDYDAIRDIFPMKEAAEFRQSALNPNNPVMQGLGQRPDVYMQALMAGNQFWEALPDKVNDSMRDIEKMTGRSYHLFDYVGHPEADRVVVCMGSAALTCEEVSNYLNAEGEKVGVVKVRLFRPWSTKYLLEALPPTVKKIACLDRTYEAGAGGLPLHKDISFSLHESGKEGVEVVGGCYGLASKEFTPAMCKSVFDNLKEERPKNFFSIGINDDVTHSSLTFGEEFTPDPTATQCVFWGLGGDGTIGANKQAIKLIGENPDYHCQAYFSYDSHKEDGATISNLRFGKNPILGEYQITAADFVAVHAPSFVRKFDCLDKAKDGATFLLQAPWITLADLEQNLPNRVKIQIAQKHLKFHVIDAASIANECGLGKRTNTATQAAFFKLSGLLGEDEAEQKLFDSIEKAYLRKKGQKVVDMNKKAVKMGMESLVQIDYPESWAHLAEDTPDYSQRTGDWIKDIMEPVMALKGDELPVSAFTPGGYSPTDTSKHEKRALASSIPVWIPDNCTQCNYCMIVCPHATIRPFLLNKNEVKAAPEKFASRKSKGDKDIAGYHYSIQIAPQDCTGCEVCVHACPDDALKMAPLPDVINQAKPDWDYAINLPNRGYLTNKFTPKGSQFQQPMLEFSGACKGCGETPYLKLATQLFGDRMIIANASGCSSVWGGSFGSHPFATNEEGRGPSWGRSLFEDNAEYGMGMFMATKQRRERFILNAQEAISSGVGSEELRSSLQEWLDARDDQAKCTEMREPLEKLIENEKKQHQILRDLSDEKDMIINPSHWIVGGDGWAYDIGFGGLDHVLASGANVNVLVLDTEMYSNTGGQVSKSTPKGAVAKFASSGKKEQKKDLGEYAMGLKSAYVASVSMGANYSQAVQSFKEAEEYPGPSIIIAYSPCIDWGPKFGMAGMVPQMKEAVSSGYWPLYRYDPRKEGTEGKPLVHDSRRVDTGSLDAYLAQENRYSSLARVNPERATELRGELRWFAGERHKHLERRALNDEELLDMMKIHSGEGGGQKVMVLYGSETGHAEEVAKGMVYDMKRRGLRAVLKCMDQIEPSDIPRMAQHVVLVASTAGQGEYPANAKAFMASILDETLPKDLLKGVKFTTFGLGDRHYVYFNKTGKDLDTRFEELGAERLFAAGWGDDQDPDRYETALEDFTPNLWTELPDVQEPEQEIKLETNTRLIAREEAIEKALTPSVKVIMPTGANSVPLMKVKLLTPANYDRDIRHFEFDLAGLNMPYEIGDSLGIWPSNPRRDVESFLDHMGLYPEDIIEVRSLTPDRSSGLPDRVSAEQLANSLDLFGKPKRRFYEMLSMVASDEGEKRELHHLITAEGKADLKNLVQNEYVSYFDLMKRFPSADLNVDMLIDFIPQVKPRLYSIASSPALHGENNLHLCIIADDWYTKSGVYKHGVCTRFLRDLDPPVKVRGKINAAAVTMPDHHRDPAVLVALGTGMAPCRAFVCDRVAAKAEGQNVGEMVMFFGSRHRASEFMYEDELTQYQKEGTLTDLFPAFSRDQKEKIYVHHLMQQNQQVLYDLLHPDRGAGTYYACGSGAVHECRDEILKAFVNCGGMTEAEADEVLNKMQMEGKYNVEAW
eukprot:CAMPEP_0201489504 /NCGR_PEP_ID=MMETSP0151_2-20130828/22837_1 /ASSEMBLY_ACC=CAM_ASM_000257 /TAXON_ID=200890 /ORGANISM="Paramoeba atlantica, Strain 621/1 / CCAP 1560/9" /LENGTH=1796 /DNA_ID=CAMNT_0047875119 /DNA_START=111 /DNA_END=5501 /DNA_ORIENTATION=-